MAITHHLYILHILISKPEQWDCHHVEKNIFKENLMKASCSNILQKFLLQGLLNSNATLYIRKEGLLLLIWTLPLSGVTRTKNSCSSGISSTGEKPRRNRTSEDYVAIHVRKSALHWKRWQNKLANAFCEFAMWDKKNVSAVSECLVLWLQGIEWGGRRTKVIYHGFSSKLEPNGLLCGESFWICENYQW